MTPLPKEELRKQIDEEFEAVEYARSQFNKGAWTEDEWRAYREVRLNKVLALFATYSNQREVEARKETAKHIQSWLRTDIDHHDLQRILTRMVEGRYYEFDKQA